MTTGAPLPPRPARRSRLRTFLPLGVAAWLVLEIWLLTVVADAVGGFTVFLLLVAGAVLGAAVMKRAGRRAFAALSETLRQQQQYGGDAPAAPTASKSRGKGNGFLMLAGALLMLPGFLSDAAGLLCLLPPVQALLGRTAEKSLKRRMSAVGGVAGMGGMPGAGGPGDVFQQAYIHRPDGKVVPGEVIRPDDRPAPHGDEGSRPPITG